MHNPTAPDPWQYLAKRYPKVKVYVRHFTDRWGQTVWCNGEARIELAHDLGPIEQRCTLAHEIQHIQLGEPCVSLCSTNEATVIENTARWLLPVIAFIGTALAERDICSAAHMLGVTVSILNDRLHTMTGSEETELAEHLQRSDEPAGAMAAYHATRRSGTQMPSCACTPATGELSRP